MPTEFSWEEWQHSTYVDLIEEEAEEAVEFFGVDSDTFEHWPFPPDPDSEVWKYLDEVCSVCK